MYGSEVENRALFTKDRYSYTDDLHTIFFVQDYRLKSSEWELISESVQNEICDDKTETKVGYN